MIVVILILLGFFAAGYGTIIGAGGGFLVVPVLLMFFDITPEIAAATGLAIVFINAVSGLPILLKQKRVLIKTGLFLSVGAFPGTFLGSWFVGLVPNTIFYFIFGCLLIGLGVFLSFKNSKSKKSNTNLENAAAIEDDFVKESSQMREDKFVNKWALLLIGIMLGIVSSFFGIGGGWLIVPILVYGFGISMKNATATSMFSLALYSFVGILPSVADNIINWSIVACTGIGVIIGSQVGAFISKKMKGTTIIRLLAMLVVIMGGSMILQV